MKLAAYYNSWDDWDMLQHSIKNIRPLVDMVIVIISKQSNYYERATGPDGSAAELEITNVPLIFRQLEPNKSLSVPGNETAKRNAGLQFAREMGATHALCMDSDEFYEPEQFLKVKARIEAENLDGVVCPCDVFFKSPTLTTGRDVTLVPFIHKLTPRLMHFFNRSYPFAWINGQIRIDPTRSYNINSGVVYTEDVVMAHMSWVRKDYEKKIRNSTARHNIERSSMRKDLQNARAGYYCEFYKSILKEVPDRFGLNSLFQ